MACNGYEIIDLGVMVPAEKIVETAIKEKVDIVGLSGLITPSLEEMVHVVTELQRAGLDIPVMIGGATTSKLHTALKISPVYHAPVVYMKDASQNALVAAKLLNPDQRNAFTEELEKRIPRAARKEPYTHSENGFAEGSARKQAQFMGLNASGRTVGFYP